MKKFLLLSRSSRSGEAFEATDADVFWEVLCGVTKTARATRTTAGGVEVGSLQRGREPVAFAGKGCAGRQDALVRGYGW
jgi:hypothetical protein